MKTPKAIEEALLFASGASLLSLPFSDNLSQSGYVFICTAGSYFILRGYQSFRYGLEDGHNNRKGQRKVTANSYHGSRQVVVDDTSTFETAMVINRESYLTAITRLFKPKSPVTPPLPPEPVFHSHYRGHKIDLRERHVLLFLDYAHRHRSRGKGISARTWVTNSSQRSLWYRQLGPYWYYALLNLIRKAQLQTHTQLIVRTGHQWYALALSPQETYSILEKIK